jgi:hypothetical protein
MLAESNNRGFSVLLMLQSINLSGVAAQRLDKHDMRVNKTL